MADPDIVTTPIMGIGYPKENLDPWFNKFSNPLMDGLDKWIARLLNTGGFLVDLDTDSPSVSWSGSSVTWDQFYILAPGWGGGRIRFASGSAAIADGAALSFSFPSNPQIDSTIDQGGYSVGPNHARGNVEIWRRSGSILHWMLPIAQQVAGV